MIQPGRDQDLQYFHIFHRYDDDDDMHSNSRDTVLQFCLSKSSAHPGWRGR